MLYWSLIVYLLLTGYGQPEKLVDPDTANSPGVQIVEVEDTTRTVQCCGGMPPPPPDCGPNCGS